MFYCCMTKNNTLIGIAVATAVVLVITGSTLPMVLAQQSGNMTAGGGGDLMKKMISAGVKAKAIQAVINNKDVFVVACDPGFTDPATQCQVYTTQPVQP